jgi:hypothetical protein
MHIAAQPHPNDLSCFTSFTRRGKREGKKTYTKKEFLQGNTIRKVKFT